MIEYLTIISSRKREVLKPIFVMELAVAEFFMKQGLEYVSMIAQGGFGTIYKVYSKKYDQFFALKQVPVESFNETELECLKSLSDSRIVNLYQYYRLNGSVYLLMEFCPTDLAHVLKTKKILSKVELQQYCYNVIAAVKACHDQNIAHCDIKPTNFLIDAYGRVKICDFGLSTITHGDNLLHCFKGTKLFLSPEIILRNHYNPFAADIWAIGVTLYFIATHQFPFNSADSKRLHEKIIACAYNPLLVEDPELRDVIDACLQIDPKERPTTQELLEMPFFNSWSLLKHSQIPLNRSAHIVRSNPFIVKPKFDMRKTVLSQSPSLGSKGFVRAIVRPVESAPASSD